MDACYGKKRLLFKLMEAFLRVFRLEELCFECWTEYEQFKHE